MSERRINLGRWVVAGIVLVAALVAVATQLPIGAWAHQGVAFFRDAGPGPFFLAMALLPLVGVPLSPFTVIAGPVFGPTMGVSTVIACAITAVAIDVALAYWISAHALRPLATRLARRFGYTLPELPSGTAWEIALLVRIVPGPPFFVQSYLLGLARVPFGVYMVVSTLVPSLYLSSAILAGDAWMRRDWSGLGFAGALCVIAGVAIYRLRKRLMALRRAG
jgi:uncharacterized membrane protein YdjX (TVP38/TMEM64 family)